MPEIRSKPTKRVFGQRARRGRRLPLSILVALTLFAVLVLIRPSSFSLDFNPANVLLPTITPPASPRPAPTDAHGGHIVFTCTRAEINQICIIAPDGTGFQQLTHGTANSYYPSISANGTDVVFAVNQYDGFDLFRVALDVNEGARQTRSRTKQLTYNVGNAFSPSYSPDGREIAFLNRHEDKSTGIWIMGSDGEGPREVYSSGESTVVALAWSPNGNLLAFSRSVGATFAFEVFTLDLQNLNSPPLQVSHGLQDIGGSIAWSPDQRDLLVFAGPAAAREIFRLELATGLVTQLTHGGNNASPAYSPDGQYIVFNSLRNGGQADLFIMRADGHSTRQLTDFPEPDWQPQWGR